MATKIVLNRKKEMVNRVRPVQCLVDNVAAGQVASGSSEEFQVTPGIHNVQCGISWFKSNELTVSINEGETRFLRVRSGMKYYTVGYILVLLVLASGLFFRFAHIPRPDLLGLYQVILLVPFLLYVLYYFTLGRKQYLILEEDKENLFN
ncbi:MAG: hypothetical protein V4539_23575 [Bacteroidota bacterium]